MAGKIGRQFVRLTQPPERAAHADAVARFRASNAEQTRRFESATWALRDGMNLIAKEYVAAQEAADPGILILSKFAGAAEEMTEALIVNPYSIEETADAIRAALEMTLAERRERHGALLAGIQKHDAAAWSQSFLEYLKRVRSTDDPVAQEHARGSGLPHSSQTCPSPGGWR